MDLLGYSLSWIQVALGAVALILPVPIAYLAYSGLFSRCPRVVCRRPPYGKMRVAYKFFTGAYCKCAKHFEDTYNIEPKNNCIGIYYDNPDETPSEKCRYIVGSIISEGDEAVKPSTVKKFEDGGYSFITFPEADAAVQTLAFVNTYLSYYIIPKKVYARMDTYIKENKLIWNPAIEIYNDESVQFMIPQNDGEKFCVPEVPYESVCGVTVK